MPVLTLGDAAIFHEVVGAGNPAVVLVHGGMCDHHDWDRLAPQLARQHAVIRLDLRGHGRSTGELVGCGIEGWAADLLALVEALALKRPVLVGHSLASRVVVEAAASAPEAIGGLVLLDGSRTHGGFSAPPSATPPPLATVEAAIDATIGPHAEAEVRRAVHARMSSASPATMAACVEAMRDWDLHRADAAFAALADRTPLLAIQSTYHDQATPRRSFTETEATSFYLDFLREAVPWGEITILRDAGHFTMLERPDAVAGLILAFAARVRETGQATGDRR